MANKKALGAEFVTLVTDTPNLTLAEKKRLRDGVVERNRSLYDEFLARTGFSDVNASKHKFIGMRLTKYLFQEADAFEGQNKTIQALADPTYTPVLFGEVEDLD